MIKGVILDLDDTLCMTEEISYQMESEALQTIGAQPMPRQLHLDTWGKPLFGIIGVRSPGVDVAAFREAFDPIIASAVREGRLDAITPDNMAAMDRLMELGKELVILTSRENSELVHLLEETHELAPRISTFYYRDNMQYHKPDPRAFQHIEQEHGWKPAECVYVGDSLGDAQAAKGAGLHFIASLESGLRTREEFEAQADAPVDLYIARFPDLVQAVQDLDKQLAA